MNIPARRTLADFLSFLPFAAFFLVVGGLIGRSTAPKGDPWYEGLDKAPLNPPDWVFGVTWSTLYVLIALALWSIWRFDHSEARRRTLGLFAVHMVANWSWNFVFFAAHELAAAVALIVFLIATAILLVTRIAKVRRWAACLMIPYISWLCFALYLSGYILLKN